MGKSKLIRLADQQTNVCGAARAFLAELEEVRLRSPQHAATTYPSAEVEAHRLIISLDAHYCVVTAINYELGLALIEYAGLRTQRTNKLSTVGSRVRT